MAAKTKADATLYHFKVCWLRNTPKAITQVQDYAAEDVKAVLAILRDSEQVTTSNTALLVIHQINRDGTVTEVMSHDAKKGLVTMDFRGNAGATRTRKVVSNGVTQQDRIIATVGDILTRAKEEQGTKLTSKPVEKPRVKLKHDKKSKKMKAFVVGGFLHTAHAAEAVVGDITAYSKKGKTSHA